jgi:uncharacterized protein with GYD domain
MGSGDISNMIAGMTHVAFVESVLGNFDVIVKIEVPRDACKESAARY